MPKEGFIYFLKSELGYCKIGRSSNLPKRMQTFAVKLPFRVELFHSFYAADSIEAERFLHRMIDYLRVNGEWFLLNDSQLQLFLPISFYKDGTFFTSSGEKYSDFYILA